MVQQSVTPYINVARIARTHGRKGEVVVAALDGLPFCLRPGMRVCLTPPPLRGERFYTVERVGVGETPLVAFSDVGDLSGSEPLVGKLVLASREDVPDAVFERDVLDCVGRELVDEVRGTVGTVVEFLQLPANDVWRVDGGPYGEVLVPVIDDVVVEIPESSDDPAAPVVVRLMPGLLPDAEEAGPR